MLSRGVSGTICWLSIMELSSSNKKSPAIISHIRMLNMLDMVFEQKTVACCLGKFLGLILKMKLDEYFAYTLNCSFARPFLLSVVADQKYGLFVPEQYFRVFPPEWSLKHHLASMFYKQSE